MAVMLPNILKHHPRHRWQPKRRLRRRSWTPFRRLPTRCHRTISIIIRTLTRKYRNLCPTIWIQFIRWRLLRIREALLAILIRKVSRCGRELLRIRLRCHRLQDQSVLHNSMEPITRKNWKCSQLIFWGRTKTRVLQTEGSTACNTLIW